MARKKSILKTTTSNTVSTIWDNLKAHFTFTCPQSSFDHMLILGDKTNNGILCSGEAFDTSNNKLVVRNDFFEDNFIKLGNGIDIKKFAIKNVTTSGDNNIITFLFKQANLIESMSELLVSIGDLKVYLINEAGRTTSVDQYVQITKADSSGRETEVVKSNKLTQNIRDEKVHRFLIQINTVGTGGSAITTIAIWINSQNIIESTSITGFAIGEHEIYFGNKEVNPIMYIGDIRLYNSDSIDIINRFKNTNEIVIDASNKSNKLYCQMLTETSDVNSQATREIQCPDNKLQVGWLEEDTSTNEVKIYKNKIVTSELGEY